MLDNNTDFNELQEARRNKSRRPPQRNIQRERTVWTEKKKRSEAMSMRLKSVGFVSRAHRMGMCADTIISDVCGKCETRYIIQAYFCRDRFCPLCAWRRSKRLAHKLGEIILINEAERKSRYIHLVLTVRNVPWPELSGQIAVMMKSWKRMNDRIRRAGVVTGWVRSFEVTRSKNFGTAHPHLHALLQVPPEYFNRDSKMFLSYKKDDIIRQWRECLGAEYSPSVAINAVKDSSGEIGAAVLEVAKYVAKGSDVMGLSDEEFTHFVNAMKAVRTWSTGGRMRIPDAEIENFLHGEEPEHEADVCGNCGGTLHEMREVWDAENKVYVVKCGIEYTSQKNDAIYNRKNIFKNININIGGNVYVNCGG